MSLKDFQIVSRLGQGAYSSVYKVKRLVDGMQYALKKVKLGNLSSKQKENALNQVRILASLRHKNVVGYKQAFLDDATNCLYIIMEYADNGDLYQKIVEYQKNGTTFPESQIWSIFIQVTRGLRALHELKVLHRDLKSANVFLMKNGLAKLGDMNVSKISRGMCETQTGTPYYASPEVWKDQPYDRKSDIWSLGCVLYEIAALKPPFRAEDMQGLYKKVVRGFYPRIPPQYTNELMMTIKQLLEVSPSLRPSCNRILELPIIFKHSQDLPPDDDGKTNNLLLSTIHIGKHLGTLSARMPKANYDESPRSKKKKKKDMTLLPPLSPRYEDQYQGSSIDSSKKNVDLPNIRDGLSLDNRQKKSIVEIYNRRHKVYSIIQNKFPQQN